MEQQHPLTGLVVQGHPTNEEVAALVCALQAVVLAAAPATADRPEPRVWSRTSLRSHAHRLHTTFPASTDGGHRHTASHPLEES